MTAVPLTLEDLERLEQRAERDTDPEAISWPLLRARADDVLRLTAALRSVMADLDETHADLAHTSRELEKARGELRSVMAERDAIRRARDEVKAAGEAIAPRNDPVARYAVWNRMRAAEKALRDLVEAL